MIAIGELLWSKRFQCMKTGRARRVQQRARRRFTPNLLDHYTARDGHLAHPGLQGCTRTYTPAEPGACVMACRMRGELGEECCCCSFHSGLSGTAVLANS